MTIKYQDRRGWAERLRANKSSISTAAMDEFVRRHPRWLEGFGEMGRIRSEEDYAFHVDFLAGALMANDPSSFRDYALWAKGVLESRGVGPEVLAESIEQIRDAAKAQTGEELSAFIDEATGQAVAAVREIGVHPTREDTQEELGPRCRMYLRAVLSGERRTGLTVALEALEAGVKVPEIYREILQPAQIEIGRLWEGNEISVADEHLATSITQYVVAQLYPHLEVPSEERGKALVTGVSGELHQIGANMVADVLEADGWNTRFLGTQLPIKDVIRTIEEFEPNLLGISATILLNLPAVADLIEGARAHFGAEIKILVGGGAFRTAPDVWTELGADGFGRDLREAASVAAGFGAI